MNLLKSKVTALAVLVLAVAGSAVYGSHRSLMKESDKVTEQKGTLTESLQTRADLGGEMYALAGEYLPENAPPMEKLQTALTALEEDIFDLDGERDIRYALNEIYSEVLKQDKLTEEDRVQLMTLETRRTEAETAIGNASYNTMALEFNGALLGTFPASVLGKLTGVEALPVYH